MNTGILTSGGDAPGMNAAINAVVKSAINKGKQVLGIKHGYQGLFEEDIVSLNRQDVDGIAEKGGTVLKTARCLELMEEDGAKRAVETLRKYDINELVVIGGDGSFKGANKLSQYGVKTVGIPGTIDNDLAYTDYCIGFDTTLNTVLESISKIKDSDSSHEKTTIVEVMGRECGDLALYTALAGGAEIISTPEKTLDFETISKQLKASMDRGKKDNIIVITERMYDIEDLKQYIEEHLHIQIRSTVLGFIQRGGQPSGFDRVLATKMGVKAIEVLETKGSRVVGIRNNQIIDLDYNEIDAICDEKEKMYDLLDGIQ